MHPELSLPFGLQIPTYGFFMMVGFLSAVWMAMKRAMTVKADPDVVLNLSFAALLAGVGGARIFYVAHFWKNQFADLPHPILAALDIRKGGLEFLGGLLGATLAIVIYLWIKRESLRVYLDILTPGAMLGLALGRVGCFFNGCCFGGICEHPVTHAPEYVWAVQFPYGSPAHQKQWEDRQVTLPAELIVASRANLIPMIVENSPDRGLALTLKERHAPAEKVRAAELAYEDAKRRSPDDPATAKLKAELDKATAESREYVMQHGLQTLAMAMQYPSRKVPSRGTSAFEIEQLAAQSRSRPVHPTQLYDTINALLLSAILSAVFHLRKRHGVVIGVLFVLYPLPRLLLESIRVDNPLHASLTISQWVSIGMFVAGVAYLVFLYRLPPLCPRAKEYVPPPEEQAKPA
jgi:phosphatidylglycerol:prolipoprotein diacylglycerol transferase